MIIHKKEYDELIRLLEKAYVIVKNVTEENTSLKRDLEKLQKENNMLKEVMRTKTLYVDFPNSKKEFEK